MKIRPSTRHTAICKIFRELKLDASIPFLEADLLRAWNHSGLRYSDLKMVMRDLILRRRLEMKTVGETVMLQLRASDSAESEQPADTLLTRSLDWIALRRVRSRRRVPHGTGRQHHRLSDRISG